MYPGDDAYYQCHACGQVVSNPTLLSGNTIGAELYSDGKMFAPMLPEYPKITKCCNCNSIFWLNRDCEIESDHINPDDAPRAEFLSPIELNRAIEEGLASDKGKEIFLRQRILWRMNDRLRVGLSLFPNYEMRELWEENCNALLTLADESKIDNLILKAEIYRYFGKFNKSKELIESITDGDRQWLVPLYLKEINDESRGVFRLY